MGDETQDWNRDDNRRFWLNQRAKGKSKDQKAGVPACSGQVEEDAQGTGGVAGEEGETLRMWSHANPRVVWTIVLSPSFDVPSFFLFQGMESTFSPGF